MKPQILLVFGDIALAIGPEFRKYLELVLQTLIQASPAQVDRSDFDMLDYLNELREGCLEAYTGIIQGLKSDNGPSPDLVLVQPHMVYIIQIITVKAHSDTNIVVCAGLIGSVYLSFSCKS